MLRLVCPGCGHRGPLHGYGAPEPPRCPACGRPMRLLRIAPQPARQVCAHYPWPEPMDSDSERARLMGWDIRRLGPGARAAEAVALAAALEQLSPALLAVPVDPTDPDSDSRQAWARRRLAALTAPDVQHPAPGTPNPPRGGVSR